jgi:hypothetical protein
MEARCESSIQFPSGSCTIGYARRLAKRDRCEGFPPAVCQHGRVFLIYFEYLECDVAPARSLRLSFVRSGSRLFQQNEAFAGAECARLFFRKPERFTIEPPMCIQITHGHSDGNLTHAILPHRHKSHAIAFPGRPSLSRTSGLHAR